MGQPTAPSGATAHVLPSTRAHAIVAGARQRFQILAPDWGRYGYRGSIPAGLVSVLGPSRASHFEREGEQLKPSFEGFRGEAHADLAFGSTASRPFRITDRRTGLWIDVRIPDARAVPAEASDGYLVYADALGSGGNMFHVVDIDGTEDFLECRDRDAAGAIAYELELSPLVSGLRLVDGTLEALDGTGTPRVRMSAPYAMSGDGHRIELKPIVRGCAVDQNPAPPWGRVPTPPGSNRCRIEFDWESANLSYPALIDPMWSSTANMSTPRQCHTATTLTSGNALVVGGSTSTGAILDTAEVYNLASNTWSAVQSIPPDGTRSGRCGHKGVLLSSGANAGRVLIIGGIDNTLQHALASSRLYDPSTGTWTSGPSMARPRWAHTATDLADGRILVVGGIDDTGAYVGTAELYALNNTFGAAGTITPARADHAASRLGNGQVLISGGVTATAALQNTNLFNPSTGAWSTGPLLTTGRGGHSQTSLSGNTVLVTGGEDTNGTALSSAELYNGSAWATKPSMSTPRWRPSAVTLPDGRVLLAGGSTTSALTERYDPTAQTWASAGNLATPRFAQATSDLGGVPLVTGGVDGSVYLASSELFFQTTGTNVPVGALDFIRPTSGVYHAEGWALDLDFPNGQIYVHIYVDGKQPSNYAGNCMTDVARPDINSAYGVTGTHGFSCTIPSSFLDGNAHTLYVFAINVPTGGNPELLDSGTAFHDVNHNPVDDSRVTISLPSQTGGTLVWNHGPYVNDPTYNDVPDGPARAVKDTAGTTFLALPGGHNHSLAGTSTETLNQIYATYTSSRWAQPPADITETDYNYEQWLTAPYYKYGRIYSIAHSEWHKCLIDPNQCAGPNDWSYSWEASLTRFVSNDGTTFARNPPDPSSVVHSNTWLSTWNYTTDHHWGFFHPSNVIREADYYYLIASYLHRDSSGAQDAFGQVLIRTQRIDLASDWQILKRVQQGSVWVNTWVPIPGTEPYQTLPFDNSDHVSLTYNTVLHKYVVFHVPYGSPVWRYATTVSLADPAWSPVHDVANSATFHTVNSTYDPSSTVDTPGIFASNYPNALDPDSPGRNFEYTDSQFFMYYDTAWQLITNSNQTFDRNLYRAAVTVTVN